MSGAHAESVRQQARGHYEVLPQSWNDEFEADTIGHSITIQALYEKHGIDPSIIHLGIEFTFHSIALIQEAQSILKLGRIERGGSTTHPPGSDRIARIRENYQKFLGEHAKQGELLLASVGQSSLDAIWEMTKPRFFDMHRAAVRPIKEWST